MISATMMMAPLRNWFHSGGTPAQRHDVDDQLEGQDTGERAEHGALAAVEADAADDRRGEDLEDPAAALGWPRWSRSGRCRGFRRRRRGRRRGQHDPRDAVDADAGGAGRLRVAADRVQRPAVPQLCQGAPPRAKSSQAHPDGGRACPARTPCPGRRRRRAARTMDWPSERPTCSPRSMVSVPRVTMKPLRRSLRMRKPLTAPMMAPTSRQSGTAVHSGRRPSPLNRPPLVGRTSHTAMTGATPMVDSSDRSIRPLIRMKAVARTNRLSSVDCWSTPMRLSEVRKAGETMNPIRPRTRIAGTRDSSRKRPRSTRRRRGVRGVRLGRAHCGLGEISGGGHDVPSVLVCAG